MARRQAPAWPDAGDRERRRRVGEAQPLIERQTVEGRAEKGGVEGIAGAGRINHLDSVARPLGDPIRRRRQGALRAPGHNDRMRAIVQQPAQGLGRWLLAGRGEKPILIERGDIDRRQESIERFCVEPNRRLDIDHHLGAAGARQARELEELRALARHHIHRARLAQRLLDAIHAVARRRARHHHDRLLAGRVEQDDGEGAGRVGRHLDQRGIDAERGVAVDDDLRRLVVAHRRQRRDPQAEPAGGAGAVGGRAARQSPDQPPDHLLIERWQAIDRQHQIGVDPADGQDIQRAWFSHR